ncbi:MAG: biopolymer transporter ExbD [Treponema sp.]|jgi:biopolymer transport protein ExbD|nr:biopolymer transporter ExbD [Treponema sp.]
MNSRRIKRRSFGESSAASDMAFLLIIYFIVIAGFNVNRGFLVNLPAKDSVRLIRHNDLLRFELDGEGNIVYGNVRRDIAFAEREIRRAVSANPNLAVLLAIDPFSPWQNVVSFVELAQDLRVDSFSFVMKKENP